MALVNTSIPSTMQEFDPIAPNISDLSNHTGNFTGSGLWFLPPPPHPDVLLTAKLAYGYLMPVLLVFGTVGNVLNLVVFVGLRAGGPRGGPRGGGGGVTYIYLKYLAVSDLLLLLSLWGPAARLGWGVHFTGLASNLYSAHVEPVLQNTCLVTSALIVLAITADRYVAVCHPLQAARLLTRRRTVITAWACIILAAILYLPLGASFTVVPLQAAEGAYITVHNEELVNEAAYGRFEWARVTITKFLPILLVTSLNLRTMVTFRRRVIKRASLSSSSGSSSRGQTVGGADRGEVGGSPLQQREKEEGRLMVMLAAVALVYVVCVTPSAVAFLIHRPSILYQRGFFIFTTVSNLLEYLNAAVNFYIYCLSSRQFRAQFVSALCRGRGGGGGPASRRKRSVTLSLGSCRTASSNAASATSDSRKDSVRSAA